MLKFGSILCFLILLVSGLHAQHTFSIVAVDSLTGEIGSAGATCGDTVVWPGTPGAYIISDVLPGVGAIHTQARWDRENQLSARNRMLSGDSPDEIIDWLVKRDIGGTPSQRQYGIVDLRDGRPRSAGYTGVDCFDYKNHLLGPNYAIQGNILLGQQILDSMKARFLRTEGSLADKLMAALQGANVVGADSRCSSDGVSSLSAFLRVARSDDRADSLTLDINIGATPDGVEPIDQVQEAYNNWQATGDVRESQGRFDNVKVYQSLADNKMVIEFPESIALLGEISIVNALGQTVRIMEVSKGSRRVEIGLDRLPNGIYWPVFSVNTTVLATFQGIVLQ